MGMIKYKDIQEVKELYNYKFESVYRGKWRGTNVAIKRLRTGALTGNSNEAEQRRVKFLSQAKLLSELKHKNVVKCYGMVEDGPGGTPALLIEYLDGYLKDVLQSNRWQLGHHQRLLVAIDVAAGMQYLHEKGMTHFDLRSANIFMNITNPSRPMCKLGDLIMLEEDFMASGGSNGNLPWLAPELLDKSKKVTKKVDVYSFGIVLWEILTGKVPYVGLKDEEIKEGVIGNTLRPYVSRSFDPRWRDLMEQCWATNPSTRPSFTKILEYLKSLSRAADDLHGHHKQDDVNKKVSASDIYGAGASISNDGSNLVDLCKKPGESDIYGAETSIDSDGVANDVDVYKFRASDIYGIGPSFD